LLPVKGASVETQELSLPASNHTQPLLRVALDGAWAERPAGNQLENRKRKKRRERESRSVKYEGGGRGEKGRCNSREEEEGVTVRATKMMLNVVITFCHCPFFQRFYREP
jgi:hypothetical protein